ncbi:MAG: 3-hydroxybutyryl-CoA dehydrogenase [Chloroflexi bacterium]|nr:3-hydroxybutyryl-CoA dehydrogenase [Chloroflexota bacterium]
MLTNIGVVTGGPMGVGIAETLARAGYRTLVHAGAGPAPDQVIGEIERSLARAVKRGKLESEAAGRICASLIATTGVEELAGCDLVIDALAERLDEKRALLAALDRVCSSATIFGCNNSVYPVGKIASATQRPDRVVGIHFFLPVPQSRLVEIIRPAGCSDATLQVASDLVARLGKRAVHAADTPGFIFVRLNEPNLMRAIRLVEEGVATPDDVDATITLATAAPIGPLHLADLVGLDNLVAIAEALHDELGDPSCAPPRLLREMVAAGTLGKKTGRGFFEYPPDPSPTA